MEMKEKTTQKETALGSREEMKNTVEVLSDDTLGQVIGGMKILQGDEGAATKGFQQE